MKKRSPQPWAPLPWASHSTWHRAIGTAKVEGDLDWLWHLLRSIPAAEGEVGDLEDSGMDIASTVSAMNGYIRADRDLPGTLRSQYVDYLLEHL